MNYFLQSLKFGSSLMVLAVALLAPNAAFAQAADEEAVEEEQEIVVTGSSIRGVPPVGSNLVAVTAEDLKATGAPTITMALQTIPALSNFGSTGQGGTAAFYQPSIHSLGASASNSTLNLIDGHRGPTGGTNHTFLDPSNIPMGMVERIEVLAEGASATYGSDAVAGVVNFITRRRFDGVEVTGQTQIMDGAQNYSAGLVAGQVWDRGSAVFGISYSDQGALADRDRPFTYPDHRGQGGTNFLNFSCSPATLQPGGSGPIFLDATSGVSVTNSSANAPCTTWNYTDRVGDELRYNAMARITLDLNDNWTVGFDLLAAQRSTDALISAGTVQATAFQTGAQANPFYTVPVGYSGAAATQTVRWDATELLGPGHNLTESDTMYASFTADYQINDDWSIDFLVAAGGDESSTYSEGTINSSVATLALNGTTNSAGNPAAVSVPGTNIIVTGYPLTAANALDVWNPAANNRTSDATIAALLDNDNMLTNTSGFQQYRAIVNGVLFSLPAGAVRAALGGEMYNTQLDQFVARANNSGPASSGSQQLNFEFSREVYSGFVEFNVPVISPDMNIPLVHRVDLNLSWRYDHYDDFGETRNPRVALNWDLFEGLRVRGNYSTSFVAPPLTILGDQFGAFGTAGWNSTTNNLQVPVSAYADLPDMGIAGCTTSSITCNISTLQGVVVVSGDPNTDAQEGEGWTIGVDFAPQETIPGLRGQITYWSTTFSGGVTGVTLEQVANTASANFLLTFYPTCATDAELAAFTQGIPQRSTTPACVSYIYRQLNSNWLNLHIEGIDYSFEYARDFGGLGEFRIGVIGTEFVEYTKSFGSGATFDILNTTGNNGTFPSVARQFRGNLGWANGNLTADIFLNYTGGYRNWSGNTVTPLARDANGNPNGGGDKVDAWLTYDLNIGYDFESGSFTDGLGVSLSVRNLLDEEPPFYNGATGYDAQIANPFGRIVTLSLRKRFN